MDGWANGVLLNNDQELKLGLSVVKRYKDKCELGLFNFIETQNTFEAFFHSTSLRHAPLFVSVNLQSRMHRSLLVGHTCLY